MKTKSALTIRSTLLLRLMTLVFAIYLLGVNVSEATSTFLDVIPEASWVNIDLTPGQGTFGLQDALNTARDLHPSQPVRIRLASGVYADNLGSEIYSHRLLRTAATPIYILAMNPAANATQLGQGINLVGVTYIGIDGVTIGPSVVGAWNGSSHADPQPLQAQAGVHIAGEARYATQNAAATGKLNYAIYGQFIPSHHIVVRNVTIQNLFELDAQTGELSQGAGMDGIKFNQAEDIWVYNNTVTQTSRHGIDNVGVHRATFTNNVISHNGGGLGIEAKGGSVDVVYEQNTFYSVRRVELGGELTDATYYFSIEGSLSGIGWTYEALRTIARNNLIINPREAGLEFSGCLNCSAVGNTIFFTAAYVIPIDTGTYYGGDAIRVHDSAVNGGPGSGAGSDCMYWNGSDYISADPCWGVGSNPPAPVGKILPTVNVTVVDNVFTSVNGTFGASLGGTSSSVPCPLNVIDGSAVLHFDANYWWNGIYPLPSDGCTTLSEGAHSVYSTVTPTATPGFLNNVNDTSVSTLATSAVAALTPPSSSPVVGAGVANPALPAVDRQGRARPTPPSMGALEPLSNTTYYTVTPSAGSGGAISPNVAQTVAKGATPTFTVAAKAGYTANVSGTCGGNLAGASYTTNAITANCTVVASFVANSYTLTVSKAGNGSGTVTSNPAGINCGSGAGCLAKFTSGAAVTLTATAAKGYVFSGWSGACTGTGSCRVTMNAAKTVTASFTRRGA